MTVQEITQLPINAPEKRQWLLTASTRDIQLFIHGLVNNPYAAKEYELARTALEIRISEEQLKAAKILEQHTIVLISLTKGLKSLNLVLVVFTAALLIVTICLAIRH